MASRSALDLLQYVHPELAQPENRPLARVGKRPRARVGDPDRQNALHMLALVDDDVAGARPLARRSASELLALVQPRGRTSDQRRRCVKAWRQQWSRYRAAQKLAVQAQRFNRSGRAVTADALLAMPGKCQSRAQKQGQGAKWRAWTPEAVQRAGFSKSTVRETAAALKDGHGKAATGSRSPWHVACCKSVCAQAILGGQAVSLQRLRNTSVHSKPLAFWVTNTMFDETKLGYSVRGFGCRDFSTLAVHGQVTWADDAGLHDEDVFYPPKALVRYSAASQWSAFQKDGGELESCTSQRRRQGQNTLWNQMLA